MILDKNLEFSDAQAITATAASENVVDLGANHPDMGGGLNAFLVTEVSEDFATCDSIKATLQDSADNSTFADLVAGPVVLTADAIAGKKLLRVPIPQGHRRYLRVNYTIAGTNATAGKVNSFITVNPQTN